MVKKEDCSYIGKLVKAHSINGELILRNNLGLPKELKKMESVFIEIDKQLVPFFISDLSISDENNAIILFEDIDTKQKAEKFKNLDIYSSLVLKQKTKKPDISFSEFIGYKAIDNTHGNVGIIQSILSYDKNPLFEIANSNILIPINPDLILSIDKKNKEIFFNLPEGLIDL